VLHAPPRSRIGSTLLNERGDSSRSTLARLLDVVREFGRQRPSSAVQPGGAVDAFASLEARARLRLRRLLAHFEVLRAEQEERISDDNADAITLCSMHSSKGLEWRHVMVARLNEGECPLTCVNEAAIEEERRLAYVALSRAKQRLFLSHVAVEPSGGGPAEPSRFLDELPPALLHHVQVYG
jgi:superfamily I DNA/RNA helicase